MLDVEYDTPPRGKADEVRKLFSKDPPWAPDVVRRHRAFLAQDALDARDGMRKSVRSRKIISVEKLDD